MTALRPTGGLIGKDSNGFKSVIRQFVGGRLQDARVERARHAMAAVGAAIQYGAVMHGGEGSVLLISRFRRHQYRMPSAMAVKDFFTGQTDFYGTARDHRKFADNNLVIERIALSSETSTVWSGNHADMARGHFQDFGQVPMQIMHILS